MEIFRLMGSILVDNNDANRSIDETTNAVEDLRPTLASSLADAVKWGAGIALAAGGAVLGVGGLAVAFGEDFTKALNGVVASTGTATDDFGDMREAMLNIYNNNFGESFEDIGTAMSTISQQTKLTGDALASTTKNALAVRDTFGIEVAESIRATNMMVKQFGMSSDEAYNLMSLGAQAGLNSNENLADTINEFAPHFASLGLSAQDMFNMMENGAKVGVFDMALLGDAVKEFGILTKDGSDATKEAFTSLGLDANKMAGALAIGGVQGKEAFELITSKLAGVKDPLKQGAIGVSLFGSMWEDMGAKGILALSNTKGSIDANVDALGKINAVKYNTFGEAMTGIKRQLETGILLPLGEKILPTLVKFSSWITENLPLILSTVKTLAVGFIQFATESKTAILEFIDTFLPLIAGVGAGAVAFGLYQLAIAGVTLATTIWTSVTTAAAVVMGAITSPIGIVVLAIMGLVAAGVFLYQHWDTMKAKCVEIWNGIKTWISGTMTSIVTYIKETATGMLDAGGNMFTAFWDGCKSTWTSVIAWVGEIITSITTYISSMGASIKTAGVGMFMAWWDGLKFVWTSIYNWIDTATGGMLTNLKNLAIALLDIGKQMFTALWDGLKTTWNSIMAWISEKITAMVTYITGTATSVKTAGASMFTALWDGLKNIWTSITSWISEKITGFVTAFMNVATPIKTAGSNMFTALWDSLKSVWTSITSWISSKITDFMGVFNNAIAPIKTAGTSMFTALWDSLKGVWTSIIGWISSKITDLVNIITSMGASLKTAGVGMFTALWDGFKTVWTGIFSWINTAIKGLTQIVSGHGSSIIEGLWQGMANKTQWLIGKVKGFVTSVGATIKDFFGIASPSKLTTGYGENVAEGLAKGIEEKKQLAIDAALKLSEAVIGRLNTLGSATITALKSKYQAEEKMQTDSLNKQMEKVRNTADHNIKNYSREYEAKLRLIKAEEDPKLKALADEINNINNLTSAEEDAAKEREYQNKLSMLRSEIQFATDNETKMAKQVELDTLLSEHARQVVLDTRTARIEAIRVEMEDIQLASNVKREAALLELEQKKANEEAKADYTIYGLNRQLESTKLHYATLMSEESLQAEARKLTLDKNNGELITLLKTYNPKWQNAGQSFGESLLNGLNSTKASIQKEVASIMAMVQSAQNAKNSLASSSSSGFKYTGKATGGPVTANTPYIVGEEGPEIFMPNTNGNIIPNDKIMQNNHSSYVPNTAQKTQGAINNINIYNPTLMNDNDADRFGELIVKRLKTLGIA